MTVKQGETTGLPEGNAPQTAMRVMVAFVGADRRMTAARPYLDVLDQSFRIERNGAVSRHAEASVVVVWLRSGQSVAQARTLVRERASPDRYFIALGEEPISATDEDALRRAGFASVVAAEELSPVALRELVLARADLLAHAGALETEMAGLRAAHSRLERLVSDTADAIVVIDDEARIRFVNPAAERLLGEDLVVLAGQQFTLPTGDGGLLEMEIGADDASGKRTIECRVCETRWEGEPGRVITLRDVTRRKRQERELLIAKQTAEQSNALKTQFLANMSHELRTPLNSIIGFSDLMLAEAFGPIRPARYHTYLSDIQSGGKRLLSLINDLLDLSKAESGVLEVREDQFDLGETAQRAVSLMTPEAVAHEVQLVALVEGEGPEIRADRGKIEQIMLNLISNAIKFTNPHGEVIVKVDCRRDGAPRFAVIDNGIGMQPHEIPRAFAAFVQVENAMTRETAVGSGLGLALCKKFAELHGGMIKLSSQPGEGTRAVVTLPASRRIESGETRPRRSASGGG